MSRRADRPGHFGAWKPAFAGCPEFGGELPVAALAEEIDTPGEGQIKALVTIAGNPVLSTPNGARLDHALDLLDFMVSVDFYLNETTRHADVILPPTCALEHDHYDLIFHVLAVRNTARYTRGDLPKEPRGAARLGDLQRARRAHDAAPAGRSPRSSARLARPAIVDSRPRPIGPCCGSGRTGGPVGRAAGSTPTASTWDRCSRSCPAGCRRRTSGSRWRRRCGRRPGAVRRRAARRRRAGPDRPAPPAGLQLVDAQHERLTKGPPRHQLLMHPADLAARGLPTASTVKVTSRVGTVEVAVQASDDMMPGVVSLPHG